MREGMGYLVDFGSLDQLIGMPNQHAYADVLEGGPGSVVHVAMGAAAALFPSHWSVLAASAFTAYEAARFAAGKPVTEFAGALVEFAFGVLLGIVFGGVRA